MLFFGNCKWCMSLMTEDDKLKTDEVFFIHTTSVAIVFTLQGKHYVLAVQYLM